MRNNCYDLLHKARSAALFMALSLFVFALPAHAAVHMLPPLDANGQPCSQLGMLQWDGNSAIKCIPGFHGDLNTGNVTQQFGQTTFTHGVEINGPSAVLGDNSSAVIWRELAEQCGGAGNVGVDAGGHLHCCPLSQVVLSASNTGVSCGTLPTTK